MEIKIVNPRLYKIRRVFSRDLRNLEIDDSISVQECLKIYRLKIAKLQEDFEKLYGYVLNEDKKENEIKETYDTDQLIKLLNDKLHGGKDVIKEDDLSILANISPLRKKLSIDRHLPEISRVLNQFKTVRRSYDKPMMTTKSHPLIKKIKDLISEAHLTMRGMHQDQVADLSAEICGDMGLNVELAREMGKHHDDGHSNGGHTGERIATYIGMLHNCGYIVHNALSADMLIQENAIKKILNLIERKEGTLSPERIEEIKQDIWYMLDGPISHNGEGNDRIIRYNPNKTPEQIKEDKNKCYTIKGYDRSIVPGSKEAAVVAFVDRICYVRTDILDGVSLGILKEFNDDYLKYIGILATKYNGDEKQFKMYTKIFEKEEELDKKMNEYIRILEEKGIRIDGSLPKEELINAISGLDEIDKDEFRKTINEFKSIKQLSEEALQSATEYGRSYVSSIPIEIRAGTVADMIKDTVVEDLKEYSRDEEFVGISPAIAKAFFGIRNENLNQIVKNTRRKYERELLPNVELKIFKDFKNALINTGIIDEYLFEKENIEGYIVTSFQKRVRKSFGISNHINIRKPREDSQEKYTSETKISTKLKEYSEFIKVYKFERKVCHHFLKLYKNIPERIEEIYKNAIDAVDDITKNDVYAALGIKPIQTDILTEEYAEKIGVIKEEISQNYPQGMTEEEIQDYIVELSNRRKNNKNELFASAIALEYVAGMTDNTLLESLRLKKYLRMRQINKGYQRGAKPEDAIGKMGEFWKGPEEKKRIISDLYGDREM